MAGDKSWSIDMQRYNFQFPGQQIHPHHEWKIKLGAAILAHQATTIELWGAMRTVGGPSTYVLGGAF